jgi:hypothetical protein
VFLANCLHIEICIVDWLFCSLECLELCRSLSANGIGGGVPIGGKHIHWPSQQGIFMLFN